MLARRPRGAALKAVHSDVTGVFKVFPPYNADVAWPPAPILPHQKTPLSKEATSHVFYNYQHGPFLTLVQARITRSNRLKLDTNTYAFDYKRIKSFSCSFLIGTTYALSPIQRRGSRGTCSMLHQDHVCQNVKIKLMQSLLACTQPNDEPRVKGKRKCFN